ncbi:hypothetical protein [Sandarakinorhabdus sp.]|uniref:hypothetical protein n=1 Tax=Sandarakinorhabdus sp. TaxID=1916663 RepID=UPI003F6FE611
MSRTAFLDTLVRSEPFRVFQILLGLLLLPVALLIGVVSPAPIGIFVAGAGLTLVLRNSRWARRRYLLHTRRHPRVRKAMDLGLMRGRARKRRRLAAAAAAATVAAGAASSLTKAATDPTSPAIPQA